MTPAKFGIAFTVTLFNQGGALVLLYNDGTVHVNHGGTEMGQGLHTKMRQIAATALGVPFDLVRMVPTRTDKVPNTSATAASSGADLNGAAVRTPAPRSSSGCARWRPSCSAASRRRCGCTTGRSPPERTTAAPSSTRP